MRGFTAFVNRNHFHLRFSQLSVNDSHHCNDATQVGVDALECDEELSMSTEYRRSSHSHSLLLYVLLMLDESSRGFLIGFLCKYEHVTVYDPLRGERGNHLWRAREGGYR